MFHESLKKQFNWNIMLRYTVKLTLNWYFMKYSQWILPLKDREFYKDITMERNNRKKYIHIDRETGSNEIFA